MDSQIKIYLERAENELLLAKKVKILTENTEFKTMLEIPSNTTFYSAVINHSYYSIFYCAKALLLTKGIKTRSPEIHKKTFEKFEKEFVNTGILDYKLLEIYKKNIIKADFLLEIFKDEKWKRGNFTYKTIPGANREPAEESVNNAILFLKNVSKMIN